MNKLADHYRRLGRFEVVGLDGLDVTSSRPLESVASEALLFSAVRDLLACQTPSMRTVGVLLFLEDFSCTEIARILDIESSTVRTMAERLRRKIQPIASRMTTLDSREEGERQ